MYNCIDNNTTHRDVKQKNDGNMLYTIHIQNEYLHFLW